jgi:gas vesicle protein
VRKRTSLLVSLFEQTVSQRLRKLKLSFSASFWDAQSRFNIERPQNGGSQGGQVKNQGDVQDATIPSSNRSSTFAYLVAGLGIGATLSIFLAPKSGAETRQWIANKCLNGIDTANEKVRQTRRQVKDLMDQSQQKISKAVDAGREAVGKS